MQLDKWPIGLVVIACTVAVTRAPVTYGAPIDTSAPSPIRRTWLNSTVAPASASSFSTRTTVPSLTRYCLPPVAMTAYMIVRTPKRAGNCSEATPRGQTGRAIALFPES